MISQLIVEVAVFTKPEMKTAPNGSEYLSMGVGLFDIKEAGPQSFTRVDCTLWSNPNLAQRIMEMDLEPRDRVLISGKFSVKKLHGKQKLRLYINDLTLLNRAIVSYKNGDCEMENIDYSILEDNVQVFDTENVKFVEKRYVDKPDDLENNEDF
jgi:hypothetical protein